jgi:hypothetical protein
LDQTTLKAVPTSGLPALQAKQFHKQIWCWVLVFHSWKPVFNWCWNSSYLLHLKNCVVSIHIFNHGLEAPHNCQSTSKCRLCMWGNLCGASKMAMQFWSLGGQRELMSVSLSLESRLTVWSISNSKI